VTADAGLHRLDLVQQHQFSLCVVAQVAHQLTPPQRRLQRPRGVAPVESSLHTASKISDFTPSLPTGTSAARALMTALRFAVDNSISQAEPRTPTPVSPGCAAQSDPSHEATTDPRGPSDESTPGS
jgi:hypothetical protein